MPNLRRRNVRDVPKDHTSGREVPKDYDTESDDEFDFGSAEEAEGGSAEESESGHKGNNRKKEPKPTKHGGDDAIKETTNLDESENRSEEAEPVRMFDSDTLNQPRAKRKTRQQTRRHHRDKRAV